MFEAIVSAYRWLFLQMSSVLGYGWAIVALSFICSALMAPLMKAVAGIVKRETEYQSVINPQLDAIKAKYATDMERHAHIVRLYERYSYSPISAVKKVLPLFVQIPFLLLTYFMLKGTAELQGVSFLFLKDLGAPDALLFGINLLPFVMTGVNLLTVVATPSFTGKDQAQAVGIALLFLVMLYTAPSALLLYWTLNNVITMFRTVLGGRAEGARLLVLRICALRNLPRAFWTGLTADRCEWLSFGFLLVSVYFWLMVYMKVWFFNCFISQYLMVPALFAALAALVLAHGKRGGFKMRDRVAFTLLVALSCAFVLAIGLMKVAPKMMGVVVRYVKFDRVFWIVLFGWVVVTLAVNIFRRAGFRSCGRAIIREGHWLIVPVILALHYAYASAFVKLPVGSTLSLAVKLVAPCVVVVAVALILYGSRLKTEMVARAAIAYCVGAFLVPMISLESGKLLGYESNLVVRLLFISLFVVLALRLNKRKPTLVFFGLLFALTLTNAISNVVRGDAQKESAEAASPNETVEALHTARAVRHNSVYLLVYDSYSHDLVLKDAGITTVRIREILLPRGFTRYDSYSVGSDTVVSMGNSFAVGGVIQGSVRSMMAGNNPLCDFLRRSGYRTSFVLGAYDMPSRGEKMPGDFYFPAPQEVKRLENVIYPCILRGFLSQSPNTFDSYTTEEWTAVKRQQVESATSTHSFVYAHMFNPGHLNASPVYRKSQEEEARAFAGRIEKADQEMEKDVDSILAKDDDSIIIVASDHGAFLRLCDVGDYGAMDLLDRCGIQLYVRWPKGYQPVLDMNCFSDVFLELMICLSGDQSLARFETDGCSLPIQYPVKAPYGAIQNGKIMMGRDTGKMLFESSAASLSAQE